MNDIFITAIEVKKVRNLENFKIDLSETERKHLIITGKNGSGKTSLLLELDKGLGNISYNVLIRHYKGNNNHPLLVNSDAKGKGLELSFPKNTDIKLAKNSYTIVFFEARREAFDLKIPQGISKIEIKENYTSRDRRYKDFIQYIVNLKAERSFAKDDNDNKAVAEIDEWFEKFENHLKDLFDAKDLKLIFDRKNYNFHLQIGNNEPFTLAQLSDGYSAVLTIVTELILRMEATGNKAYDLQGVVLIDEIETHLHVALQKKIMPFLCDFFPKIQFIVTTHSPFVLSSISNAVICDLERKEVMSDLSGYTYDALVESYFNTDEYSEELKKHLYRYKFLSELEGLTDAEEDEYDDLEDYFDNLPKFRAAALSAESELIGLKKILRKG